MTRRQVDTLVVVLGDQLDRASAALEGLDPDRDLVWMAEVDEEATHVWSHKARIALFLAAMRHFRDALRADGLTVRYLELDEHRHRGLDAALRADLRRLKPRRVRMAPAGDHRVAAAIARACESEGVPLEIAPERHFLCSLDDFDDWASGRRTLVLEHFYRRMRRATGRLVDDEGKPAGGEWNFDSKNRRTFGREGPGMLPRPPGFAPDAVTREVLGLVARRFPEHPGSLEDFDWPVTARQASDSLRDFVAHRLPAFGPFQDAMWEGEPFLHHSLLSASMNLKLLSPREVLDAVEDAWRENAAPLPSVEGFVRQVLGWREYVRGLYWRFMPGWLEENALDAHAPLPDFYWTGATDMACLRAAIGQTLEHGYAHHIQRLMVTGLFALLLGVEPKRVHEWYLAVYVDAVEWVELPNVLGMSQYADGGRMASKPYVASGRYIERMSNHCAGCRFNPAKSTGEEACPFTTLYWDFLDRHEDRFSKHPRTALQWRNLARLDAAERRAIRGAADGLRARLG